MTESVPGAPLTPEISMPMVGFGTWQLRGETAYAATRAALDVGYRHLDTATMYGNEAEVGRALRDSGVPREDVFVTTKLPPERAVRARATLEQSLRLLGVDAVDLWLIHWPPDDSAGAGIWAEMLRLRDEGLTRTVGVSNYDMDQIDELVRATGEAPVANQISWSPGRYDAALVEAHRERGVVLEGYSPLKHTRLDNPVLIRVADAHSVTAAQVVLRWHVDHGIPVIPRSSRRERVASNFDVFGFALTPAEVAAVDGLGAG
jgi:diketogulonate reductase-like aldo/keto reductase